MKYAFLLLHVRNEDTEEGLKTIGIYSSEENALHAKEKLKHKPGFRDFPEGFHVIRYEIDVDSCVEGFGVC